MAPDKSDSCGKDRLSAVRAERARESRIGPTYPSPEWNEEQEDGASRRRGTGEPSDPFAASDRSTASIATRPIPGGWRETTVAVAGREIALLLPADADELLNQLDLSGPCAPSDEPYWARLWPTSVAMAGWLLQERWDLGKRALELGCGIGLVGIAALHAGIDVTFSDCVPLAVELAVANARRNGFGSVAGQVFAWDQPTTAAFPLIFASDVLYDPHQHEPLLATLASVLAEGGTCYIGDPGRYHVAAFVERCPHWGFHVALRDERGGVRTAPASGEYQLLIVRWGQPPARYHPPGRA